MVTIDKKSPDWNRIKAEYVSGTDSLRELSEKYKVPWSTLRQRAYREKWGADRKKTQTKVEQIVVKEAAKKVADNATLAADIKRKGLILLNRLFDDFAQYTATERRESTDGITEVKRLRDLTAAYKELTEDIQTNDNASNALLQSLMDLERKYGND